MFHKLRQWLVGWILSVTSLSLGTAHAHWFYLSPMMLMEDNYVDEVVKTPLMFDLPVMMRLRLSEEFRVPAAMCRPHQHPLINRRVG